jgi:hypothetical protein
LPDWLLTIGSEAKSLNFRAFWRRMTTTPCTGTNPHGELLSKAKDLSDAASGGALAAAADKGKTTAEAVADELAAKVYSTANSALRELVIGPVDVYVGPLLEQLDDALPRKVEIPPQHVLPADGPKTFADFFINGFCEDTYTGPDIGISTISYVNVDLAQAVAQGIRDTVHICARPAEAISEGLQTEASVELIVNTIHTLSPEIQKRLGLDAFATDLQNKVGGDPKVLLSSLIHGTASVAGNIARSIPEASTRGMGANRSFAPDVLLEGDIPPPDLVSSNKGLKDPFSSLRKDSAPTDGVPFNVPQGRPGLGGERLSSSADVLLKADIPLPDLVSPATVPQGEPGLGGDHLSSSVDVLLKADVLLLDLVSSNKGPKDPFSSLRKNSAPTGGVPFNVPQGRPGLGGEHLSSSVDVLLKGDISLPGLVLPSGLHEKGPSPHDKNGGHPTPAQKPADSTKGKQPSAIDKKAQSKVLDFSKSAKRLAQQLGAEPDPTSDFNIKLDDRPPDFERFTGKVSVTFGPDRQAELRSRAALYAYYEKNGWPKAWLEYELKVRRNKVQHREEKVVGIDSDIKLEFQKGRVHQAFENLQKAEQTYAKTGNRAYKVSEAYVNYVVESELLDRFRESTGPQAAPKGSSSQPFSNGKEPSKDPKAKPSAEGARGVVAPDANQPSGGETAPSEPPVEGPTESDIQALETEIGDIDVKIEVVGNEENRAKNRVQRYKKPLRKQVQKFLHTVFIARKPGTVVEEETILQTLNHEQKGKLEKQRAFLLSKLEEMIKLVREKPAVDLSEKKIAKLASPEPESSDPASEKLDADPNKAEGPQSEEQSPESAAEATTENSYSSRGSLSIPQAAKGAALKAKEAALKAKERVVQVAKDVEKRADGFVLEGHEKAFYGKKQLHEAKRFQEIAELIDEKLSDSRDGVSLKMKDGQIKIVSKEQAQRLKAKALQESAARVDCAARNVIEGGVGATAAHSIGSGARRLGKQIDKIHLTGANALGSNAGAAVVDLGARCIAEGRVSKEAVGDAAKQVACQTVKGVATQVFQEVARSAVKGAVKEVAPRAARCIPGVAVLNSAYTIGSAVCSANTPAEALCNGASAAVDLGISCGCAAAGQALIPIPFVGAFVGSAAGALVIKGKNGLLAVFRC